MSAEPESFTITPQHYEEAFNSDNIFIKHELASECAVSNDAPSGRMENRDQPASSGTPFCFLCLREGSSDVLVRFTSERQRNHICVTDGQRKLEQVLGLTLSLSEGSLVCRACWKLVEIVVDFRESCLMSFGWIEQFSRGIQYDPASDVWLSRNVFSSMETVHEAIHDNQIRIDMEEVIASSPPEIKVPKKARQKPAMRVKPKLKVEIQAEDKVGDSEGVSNKERYTVVNPPMTLLGDDNYNPSILACEKCGRKFDGEAAHRTHVLMHCSNQTSTTTKLYSCSICNASFKELCGLKFHMNKHNGLRPFKCRKFCDRTFSSNYVRIKHERRMCEVDGRICPTCGIQLKNELSLKHHIEAVHGEAKHVCDTCGKAFRIRRALRIHQRVHSDERHHFCKVCGKGYKSRYAIKVHMRTHTQEKPFACHLCDQTFNYKISMKSHIERHHGQTV